MLCAIYVVTKEHVCIVSSRATGCNSVEQPFQKQVDLVLLWGTGTCIDLGRSLELYVVPQGSIA